MSQSTSASREKIASLCPKSLDIFTIEPFNSLAFFDPLLNKEPIPLSRTGPPISFPDLSLPLVPFDSHVPRSIDTGECREGMLYSVNPKIMYPGNCYGLVLLLIRPNIKGLKWISFSSII